MSDCCDLQPLSSVKFARPTECPDCGEKGQPINTITLKSLLKPTALARLDPQVLYSFCSTNACNVVYYAAESTFTQDDLKVPVYHKDDGLDTPVCYCFGWTRRRLAQEIAETGCSTAVAQVTEHTKAGRCGCDVNNPQGTCCLGELRSVVKELMESD